MAISNAVPVLKIDEMLPLLASTYGMGRLVPFIGAGMSRQKLADWKGFINNLETAAGAGAQAEGNIAVRAQRIAEMIRNGHDEKEFWKIIEDSLRGETFDAPGLPKQTEALAAIFWPLTISTNYDHLFYCACRKAFDDRLEPMVLGRSADDCKQVVSALASPFDREIIWHIQGYLGEPCAECHPGAIQDENRLTRLRREMVIGHGEYRKAANTAIHFRRCFGEVFRSRSLLFLGSSLTEEYFWNLFGEMLELCGPSPIPHFAFVYEKDDIDVRFLAEEMNITVCTYEDHRQLIDWLSDLKTKIDEPTARISNWRVELKGGSSLEIAPYRNLPVPETYSDYAMAVIVRAYPEGLFDLDRDLGSQREELQSAFKNERFPEGAHVLPSPQTGIFAVRARTKPEAESESDSVGAAVQELLGSLDKQWNTLHLHYPSAGGTVPPIYGFIELVRAFGFWACTGDRPLHLVVHVGSQVLLNVNSGQINLRELIISKLIRFWAIVNAADGGETRRRVLYKPADTLLSVVLADVLGIDDRAAMRWSMSVCPSPKREPASLTEKDLGRSLRDVGVVFGSVLSLDRTSTQSAEIARAAGV
jgi:hypothetical protein